ncbi:uncharacterized protein A4U43_C07F29010 [Asparagus officinalis]|uniref:Uncharacterized protein n=1 Tax=Asparagus officinalis TaxID=4686 RepID=A0A5P1EFT5_ASPOF|nr:uncharacterized protein A4U43_C07F29010 [Asparagus officinalis]
MGSKKMRQYDYTRTSLQIVVDPAATIAPPLLLPLESLDLEESRDRVGSLESLGLAEFGGGRIGGGVVGGGGGGE